MIDPKMKETIAEIRRLVYRADDAKSVEELMSRLKNIRNVTSSGINACKKVSVCSK